MHLEEQNHSFLHFLASKHCLGHFWAPGLGPEDATSPKGQGEEADPEDKATSRKMRLQQGTVAAFSRAKKEKREDQVSRSSKTMATSWRALALAVTFKLGGTENMPHLAGIFLGVNRHLPSLYV